ncbi:MAG: hypothetical protein OEY12_05600 [Nitrospira sp.]|nr:hypothetical protein [Nitrospira sp.]
MESLGAVATVLCHRGRHDLAKLLSRALVDFDVSSTYGSLLFSLITTAEIYAPISDYDQLRALSREDNEAILDAVLEIWPPRAENMEITGIIYRLDPGSLKDSPDDTDEILQLLDRVRNIMIAVSTGGPRIDSVNSNYKQVYSELTEQLQTRGLHNPVPYADLWDWYGKWSSGDLPTYQSRREYIRELFGPIETRLREGPSSRGTEVFPGPTGWARVDRTLGEARSRLESATNEEQFQAVGLLCREAIISLAQTVFDPDRHPPLDDVEVSNTDAKRMLDRYLAVEVAGKSNSIARKHAKASLDLANELTHKRTAEFREAALCAEATASVINIIAILSGMRDPGAGTG